MDWISASNPGPNEHVCGSECSALPEGSAGPPGRRTETGFQGAEGH